MSREVADYVRGRCRVIAVSNQGIDNRINGEIHPALAPWADALIASDRRWWIENPHAVKFAGMKFTVDPPGGCERFKHPDVISMKNGGAVLFDDRPTHLGGGGNSGFHAVHLAAHFGARRVLLCGFDMKPSKNGQHWFGEHEWRQNFQMPFDLFIERFTQSAPAFRKRGIEIINCTPGSALKCFPFMSLQEALP